MDIRIPTEGSIEDRRRALRILRYEILLGMREKEKENLREDLHRISHAPNAASREEISQARLNLDLAQDKVSLARLDLEEAKLI
jgi:hypothetical protein